VATFAHPPAAVANCATGSTPSCGSCEAEGFDPVGLMAINRFLGSGRLGIASVSASANVL